MITVTTSVWQFPLIALGMAALLVCAVSPRLPFRRVAVPGAAFIASIAYSAYLVQKLVIHFVAQFLATQNISLTSFRRSSESSSAFTPPRQFCFSPSNAPSSSSVIALQDESEFVSNFNIIAAYGL